MVMVGYGCLQAVICRCKISLSHTKFYATNCKSMINRWFFQLWKMLQQQISNKNEKTGDFQPLSDTNIVIRYVTTKGMGNKLWPQKKCHSHIYATVAFNAILIRVISETKVVINLQSTNQNRNKLYDIPIPMYGPAPFLPKPYPVCIPIPQRFIFSFWVIVMTSRSGKMKMLSRFAWYPLT